MHLSKKTKIVCTIGPASEREETLIKLLKAGMNVMRLNFSHGDLKWHKDRINSLRRAVKKTGLPAAIIADLGGPKIRIGDFYKDDVFLKEGRPFTLTTTKIVGSEKRVFINYPPITSETKKGDIILLDDGKKKLKVLGIKGNEVRCKIVVGGRIMGRRGVNLPGANLSIGSMTKKDKKDLDFGMKNKVDFVALSFVRKAEDILKLRKIINKKGSSIGIIAKIETPEAVLNIDKIIEASDGIMIARGDLAIEVPAENVPLIQKMIINKCNEIGKPVITATQMLESMMHSPVPTRAEVSDVANAILDGTDAVMLSGETTLGENPVEAVLAMSRIAERIEKEYLQKQLLEGHPKEDENIGEAITASGVKIADRIDAKLLISVTKSGYGARMLARYRPRQPILVFTPNPVTFQRNLLSFGCYPITVKKFKHLSQLLEVIKKFSIESKFVKAGDKIIIATGMPFAKSNETNMLSVVRL